MNAVDLHKVAILLDVDGTLLDIAPTPSGVRVPPKLRDTLSALWQRSGGAVALVSGRRLAEIDRIFAPLRLPAIGGHGAEMRFSARGHPVRNETAALDPRVKRRFEPFADHGVLIEDKGYALALHYRHAPDQEAPLRRAIEEIRAEIKSGVLEVLPGKAVIEIKPAQFNKGTAVRELMKHPPFVGRRPIFVGDDFTDEAAFAVLPHFGGIGISVGRTAPGVSHVFPTPHDVRHWLGRVVDGHGADHS